MKKTISILLMVTFLIGTIALMPLKTVYGVSQTMLTRLQAQGRALNIINLTWIYSKDKNSYIDPKYTTFVEPPKQFLDVTTSSAVGIPYAWGGLDGIDTNSYGMPWTSFINAIDKGAFAGNVLTDGSHGFIPGTAGLDCSGFVQAVFNIVDGRLTTQNLFNTYFTKIDIKDIKHMDILNKSGEHAVIFDKWGTLNGRDGAFTYESTPDQSYGGIQGTKKYFLSMNMLNNGYIPGRYKNILDDDSSVITTPIAVVITPTLPDQVPALTPTTPTLASVPTHSKDTTSVPSPKSGQVPTQNITPTDSSKAKKKTLAQISNASTSINIRTSNSITSKIIDSIPKGTIIYLMDYNNGWYKINYNGSVGWIYETLISKKIIPKGNYVTINNTFTLNIRSNPSSTSNTIFKLRQGQYARVLGFSKDNKWLKININGVNGWANKVYLKSTYIL